MASSARDLPPHVRPDQVVSYDYHGDPRIASPDVQRDVHALHRQPRDIFYSPDNGGFWVVTRFDLQTRVLRDHEHFSNRELDIPASNSPNVMIPLNLDPPDHLPYRMALMRHFDQKRIRALEPRLRHWANHLIDGVIDRGGCEFSEEIGAAFPVSVFMELMGMPMERFEEYRAMALEFFGRTSLERRIELQRIIMDTMWALFEAKRATPQDDLMSRLLADEVRGRKLSDDELRAIGFLLFLAGLDTVANTLGFTWRHLALDPALRRRLRDDPGITPTFVEEALRRCSIVQQPRIVKKDIDIEDVAFREGDMVVCPLALAGMDERRNPDPETIDLDRADRAHLAFSTGPHTCVGNFLARMEMRVLTEEWLRRIPDFTIDPDYTIEWRTGGVMALSNLHLRWDAPR